MQHERQSWAQCRAQRPVTPTPSCPGRHGVDVTHVLSATPLYRAVVRLMSREWLVALIGCDVLSGRSVEMEARGPLPSQPRARRRIGTASEALHVGPRARRKIDALSEAFRARPRARQRFGWPPEAFRARPRARRRVGGLIQGQGLANSLSLGIDFDRV